MSPQNAKHWYDVFLPMAERGGPLLTLLLAVILVISMLWLTGWIKNCVDHNRTLNEKILAQQAAFYQEFRLALSHCQPRP